MPIDHDAAVRELASPSTWCQGADHLTKLGDWKALADLARAWSVPVEADKMCLSDAMEALGGKQHAAEVYAADKLAGLVLMRLFADDAHLPTLVLAVDDADDKLRRQAIRALLGQLQTPAWRAAMLPLLDSPRLDVRKAVAESLGKRDEPEVIAALKARAAIEPDPDLKAQLVLVSGP